MKGFTFNSIKKRRISTLKTVTMLQPNVDFLWTVVPNSNLEKKPIEEGKFLSSTKSKELSTEVVPFYVLLLLDSKSLSGQFDPTRKQKEGIRGNL